jgi:hypothetical protein
VLQHSTHAGTRLGLRLLPLSSPQAKSQTLFLTIPSPTFLQKIRNRLIISPISCSQHPRIQKYNPTRNMPPANPLDYIAIQNTLARYCEALDTKDWPLLNKVRIPPSHTHAPHRFLTPSTNKGLHRERPSFLPLQTRPKQRIRSRRRYTKQVHDDLPLTFPSSTTTLLIQARLGPIITHHSLTTSTLVFAADGKSATAKTHFVGCHFGQGPHEGEVLQAWGRYEDELEVQVGGDVEGVPGASGTWRIRRREVSITKRVGDERVMSEF